MRHPRFRLLPALLAIVVVALLTLPVAVSAAAPDVQTFHNEDSFTFSGPCPNDEAVTLFETYTEDVRVTTFLDRNGNPIRI